MYYVFSKHRASQSRDYVGIGVHYSLHFLYHLSGNMTITTPPPSPPAARGGRYPSFLTGSPIVTMFTPDNNQPADPRSPTETPTLFPEPRLRPLKKLERVFRPDPEWIHAPFPESVKIVGSGRSHSPETKESNSFGEATIRTGGSTCSSPFVGNENSRSNPNPLCGMDSNIGPDEHGSLKMGVRDERLEFIKNRIEGSPRGRPSHMVTGYRTVLSPAFGSRPADTTSSPLSSPLAGFPTNTISTHSAYLEQVTAAEADGDIGDETRAFLENHDRPSPLLAETPQKAQDSFSLIDLQTPGLIRSKVMIGLNKLVSPTIAKVGEYAKGAEDIVRRAGQEIRAGTLHGRFVGSSAAAQSNLTALKGAIPVLTESHQSPKPSARIIDSPGLIFHAQISSPVGQKPWATGMEEPAEKDEQTQVVLPNVRPPSKTNTVY